jgi:hypothetical protein
MAEIEVLDAQAHGFHEPEAAAIHDLSDQFPRIFQVGKDAADFLAGRQIVFVTLASSSRHLW